MFFCIALQSTPFQNPRGRPLSVTDTRRTDEERKSLGLILDSLGKKMIPDDRHFYISYPCIFFYNVSFWTAIFLPDNRAPVLLVPVLTFSKIVKIWISLIKIMMIGKFVTTDHTFLPFLLFFCCRSCFLLLFKLPLWQILEIQLFGGTVPLDAVKSQTNL